MLLPQFSGELLQYYSEVKELEDQRIDAKHEQIVLSPSDKEKISFAYNKFVRDLSDLSRIEIKPISKSELDGMILYAYSKKELTKSIANYYLKRHEEAIESGLRQKFTEENLNLTPVDPQKKLQIVLAREIINNGIMDYIIAALIRIFPVFLFGFICGIIFGKDEIFSIAIAGALAAFLLSWPIMLLWGTVVTSSWSDYKNTFVILYCLYIVSFHFTARFGGLLGGNVQAGCPQYSLKYNSRLIFIQANFLA